MENLSLSEINIIKDFIGEKKSKLVQEGKYVNTLLKSDVLDLLDEYCTVIYYPLDDDNNGFHVSGYKDSKNEEIQFVFINTHQTIEKQIFTAAHELGHIWGIYKIVFEKLNLEYDPEKSEKIINRFAAELLMPKEEFEKACERHFGKETIFPIDSMLKIIAELMNDFMSPYISVVIRLGELHFLPEDSVDILIGRKNIKIETFRDRIIQILAEKGYVDLVNISNKKWIKNIVDYIKIAEKQQSLPKGKIDSIKKEFDINTEYEIPSVLEHHIDLTKEG